MKFISPILSVLFMFMGLLVQSQPAPMSLEECILMAVEKNISVKQSELSLDDAALNKKDAQGNFLPSLNAQANHSWNIGLNQDITRGTLENQTTQFTSVGASVNIDIYNGFRNFNQLHRANLALLAREYQLEDMKDDVRLMVVNAYLQILFNIEILDVQKSQLEITRRDAARTQEMIDAGTMVKYDLLEIEATMATQEQGVIRAENNLRLSKINLAQMLLITDYDNFDVVSMDMEAPLGQILFQKPKDIFEQALTHRKDIKLSLTNIAIAEKDIELAKGALQPSLTAFYGYNSRVSYADRITGNGVFADVPIGFIPSSGEPVLRSVEGNKLIGPMPFGQQFDRNAGHNIGVRLNIPIFNGNATRNNVERSKVNLLRSQNQLEQEKLNLENTINQAHNDAEGAYKFYEAAQKTQLARKRAYEDAVNRFEAGVMNIFDFNQIKQRYEVAASDVVRAKFDYIFKLKVLEFYFGISISL
ncbi:MAG: TolC family protein [Bacteroidetes bacterium]|nr:TolC family protein [Bacteroidota bacterium]MDA0936091.1 TolC family protein [Bacteroidota bacterium]